MPVKRKKKEDKKLVVIYIPTFNEKKTLGKVVNKIREHYIYKKKDFRIKIVVVDDGSRDDTARVALNLLKKGKIDHITTHIKNLGLGAATRSGLRIAKDMSADIAVKIDADFQHDPEDIEKVIRPILEDKTDVCFGSRFMGKIKYKMPFYRKLGNSFFSFMTRHLTGLKITDGQTGLIATNRRYLEKFRLTSDYNETQQMIIDAWRNQLRFMEVPVVFHKRTHGKSFISFKYPFIVFPNIFRLFIHACPLKIFLPIGIVIMFFGFYAFLSWLLGLNPYIQKTSVAILMITGLQIILFGFIADIISKKR